MKRALLIALTVLTLHLPALAQNETPTAEPTPIVTETPAPVEEPTPAPAPELETAFERILTLVGDISFLPWSAALVLLLTQLTKRYLPFRAAVIALAWQVIIWVVYAVANHYGFGQNVQDYVGAATKILEAILTVAPPMVVSALATEVAFRKLTRQDVPGFKKAAA
jgi:hypothetical protein